VESDEAKLTFQDIVYNALIKPAQIYALDPAAFFSSIYIFSDI
jgi:hypothetical protein